MAKKLTVIILKDESVFFLLKNILKNYCMNGGETKTHLKKWRQMISYSCAEEIQNFFGVCAQDFLQHTSQQITI